MYSCSEHSLDLQAFVGVLSNSTEEEGTFPTKFCNPCHIKLRSVKKASNDGFPLHPLVAMDWSPHHQDDCKVRDN